MDLIILIPLGLVALVGAYLCYHFIFKEMNLMTSGHIQAK